MPLVSWTDDVWAGQSLGAGGRDRTAWPAWKAWDSDRHLDWSALSQEHAVPSACLSATSPAGGAASRRRSFSGQSSAAGRAAIAAMPTRRSEPAVPPAGFLRDSVSPRSRPRRRGLRRSAARACRPTVRAARRGPRQRRSRPSPPRPQVSSSSSRNPTFICTWKC
jgi:hypothetical protein